MPSQVMELLTDALRLLHWAGVTVYGGSLVAFAALLLARRHLAPLDTVAIVRTWRAWGAGLGLSLGALIFSGLALHYLDRGAFTWPTVSLQDKLFAAKNLIFLVLWFSSFHLEIWTLDPARKLDGPEGVRDAAAYEACARRVALQAAANAGLFLLVGALGVLAAR